MSARLYFPSILIGSNATGVFGDSCPILSINQKCLAAMCRVRGESLLVRAKRRVAALSSKIWDFAATLMDDGLPLEN